MPGLTQFNPFFQRLLPQTAGMGLPHADTANIFDDCAKYENMNRLHLAHPLPSNLCVDVE